MNVCMHWLDAASALRRTPALLRAPAGRQCVLAALAALSLGAPAIRPARAAEAGPNLVANGGFEEVAEPGRPARWRLEGATVQEEGAAGGRRCVRVGDKPGEARQSGIAVKPRTGYVARCRIRLEGGGAHFTFGMLQSDGTYFVCRDAYAGSNDAWDEVVLPFRTEEQTSLGVVVSKRYGQAHILYDDVEVREEDGVRVGDVSPSPNPFPTPTRAESARGYILSSQPWLEPVSRIYYPTRAEVTREVKCRLAPGEAEPATFSLTALRALKGVRVSLAGDLKGRGGARIPASNVEVRVLRCLTRWLTCAAPLKPGQRFERRPLFLFPNAPADVPARETQLFWATVQAPADARPGAYTGELRVAAEGAPEEILSLRVEVLPIRLAEPDITYGMYYRHSHQVPELKTEEHLKRALRDMRAHGMNSMSVYAHVERKTPDGFRMDLDHAPENPGLNRQMALLGEAGLLSPRHPLLLLATGKTDGSFWGEEKTIAALQAEQRRRGWPEFLLYLVDEPSGSARIAFAKELNDIAHRVPGVRTTTALGVPRELAPYYDVWIVGDTVYTMDDVLAQGKALGKEVWTYDCVSNGCQPRNDRYFAGYFTWSAGLRGNWQWCYTEDGSARVNAKGEIEVKNVAYEDPWYAMYLLPSPDGPIPTLGWEARREGVDDYRYLRTLQECVEKAGADSRDVRAARAFLDDVRRRTHRPPLRPMASYPAICYERLTHPRLAPADYDAIRRRAAELIMRLQRE